MFPPGKLAPSYVRNLNHYMEICRNLDNTIHTFIVWSLNIAVTCSKDDVDNEHTLNTHALTQHKQKPQLILHQYKIYRTTMGYLLQY